MSDKAPTRLPVLDAQPDGPDEPSCSPTVYVSNEEKVIAAAMLELRERAVHLRERLKSPGSDEERGRLTGELEALRSERAELAVRRDEAFRRKMIMLGHLPPDDEISLF
jgi:hypothetical protein